MYQQLGWKESKSKEKRDKEKLTVNSNSMKCLPQTRLTTNNNHPQPHHPQYFSNKENISLVHCLPV